MPITELATCWRVDVQYKGKRVRQTAATYGDAVVLEERIKYELRTGQVSTTGNKSSVPTLRQLYLLACDDWRNDKSDRQRRNADEVIERFYGWDWTADRVTNDSIMAMAQAYRKDGLAETTIDKKKAALSKLFTMGRRHGLTNLKPYFGISNTENERIRWLRDDEAERLTHCAFSINPYYSDLVTFLLDTGLRLSEFRAASPVDVVDGALVIPDTKNGDPRTVPLTERAAKAFRRLKRYAEMPEPTFYEGWHACRRLAGLDEEVTPHVLRHTCATRLLRAGVDIRVVQKWMGHKRIETTLRYAKLTPGMLRDAVSLLEKHIAHGTTD